MLGMGMGMGVGVGAVSAPGEPAITLDFVNSNELDPRVSFSRGTNATYVDSLGNIAYAPSNLLTYSEQFDNAAWSKFGTTTVSANTTIAPNGEMTADSVAISVSSGIFQSASTSANTTYTVSIWVRGDTPQTVQLISNTNLGEVSAVTVNITTAWQRVSLVKTTTTGTSTNLQIANSSTGATFQLWGAQLNLGDLQPYNSTTVKNLLGYTQDFDNAAWTKSNSFIQTNLLTYSEQFDNAAWTKINSSITENVITAPDGSLTADKLVEDTATGFHRVVPAASSTVVAGGVITTSVYAKQEGRTAIAVYPYSSASGANFNLATGTVISTNGGVTAQIVDVGNGWYRCSASIVAPATSAAPWILPLGPANATSYTGDGTSGIYIWGAQLVQGATPGDYQATTTAALAVQYRAPDGSLTADKLVENTATGFHATTQAVAIILKPSPVSFSIYAKQAERSTIRIRCNGYSSNGFSADFNLATGVVNPVSNAGTAVLAFSTITPAGDGWYRCVIVGTTAASGAGADFDIFIQPSSYTGDGTSGVYIWGTQLSDSASLDPYSYNFTTAPTAAAYYGPRFDYDPTTLACKGLLIEEQRTNSIRNNTMQGAVVGAPGTLPTNWGVTSLGLTQTIVGTGTENGIAYIDIRLNGTTTGQFGNIRFEPNNSVAASSGQTWATSAYLKLVAGSLANLSEVGIVLYSFTSVPAFISSSNTGAAVNATLTRFLHVGTLPATTVFAQPAVYFNTTAASGQAIDITLRIGLPQLELGAFATSVIPTTTTAVTRAADVAVIQGANFSNWYNQSEGTLYAEFVNGIQGSASATGQSSGVWAVADSSLGGAFNGYGVRLALISNSASAVQFSGRSGATIANAQPIPFGYLNAGATYKTASAWNAGNIIFAISGVAGASATNTVASLLTVQNIFHIGTQTVGGAPPYALNGHIARIAYWPRRSADGALQRLTQ